MLSTLAVAGLNHEPLKLAWWEMGKGLLFVLATGAALRCYLSRVTARQEQLVREQERLQSIINRSPFVAYVAENTKDWPLRYVSDNIRQFGYTKEEFLTSNARFPSLVHPDDLPRVMQELQDHLLAGRLEFTQEYRLRTKSGEYHWLEDHTVAEHDRDGNVVELQGVISDITERRRAQEELEKSRRQLSEKLDELEQIYRHSPVGLFAMDREHRYVRVNDRMAEYCDMKVEEQTGATTSEVVSKSADQLMEYHRQVLERGEPLLGVEVAGETKRNPGVAKHWVCHYFPLFDAHRGVKGLTGVVIDVTRERLAEKERRIDMEKMALQAAALEAAANSIVITDAKGRIQWVNRAFSVLTGYTSEEAVGLRPSILKSGRQDPAFYRDLWTQVAAGKVWHGELTNRRKDGTLYEEDMTISPVRNAAGAVSHFIAIKQDITEHRRMEKQFLQAQRMESIGLLAGGVAHDLNNVLTPIMAAIQLLRADDLTSAERAPLVDMLTTCCRRGADIVQQVLTFARGMKGDRVPTALRPLVDDMARVAQETFPRHITIQCKAPKSLWPIPCDPTQIHQIILNLAVNARDAMPHGGTLTFAAENVEITAPRQHLGCQLEPGPYVRLVVTDTGTGIPPEVLDRIFEPFFTTKAQGHGTGLGLSALLGIVRNHRGLVDVKTVLGKGTTFEIYLPAAKDGLAATEGALPHVPQGNGEQILVVDDELSILKVVGRVLERNGYEVSTATDGASALAMVAAAPGKFKLVLTDIMMPKMDGVSLVRGLRRLAGDTKAMAMSGLLEEVGKPDAAAELRALGVRQIVAKPCAAENLLLAVNQELAA
ncbi:MAG TPA: PAS domain S-box protein [Verrucomicrobiae bacterium]|nr:PAS domain S-box protein [Verrucomicrobiae bacterium]